MSAKRAHSFRKLHFMKLIATLPGQRKETDNPYTSVNGNMFPCS
jgi:hypothetical protein